MKTIRFSILFLCLSFTLKSAAAQQAPPVIPVPVHYEYGDGHFKLTYETAIVVSVNNAELDTLAAYLSDMLSTATWTDLVITSDPGSYRQTILLKLDKESSYKDEAAYKLIVKPEQIKILAPTAHGIFYGIQTLRQLLPPAIEYGDPSLVPQNVKWTIPSIKIEDYPRFEYRGMHLDVGRHFFNVEFVKHYLDLMAMHKVNRFHWHLTEDQGWRIQIKKYPKLTKVGAWRDSVLIGSYKGPDRYTNKRYGGFYTQEEIREVVEYAEDLYITVIPEIEMPGHASAALAAYPWLGCKPNKDYHVKSTWGVFEEIYCPSEKTFTFLENVLTEVMALFPSKYIHIGGDEAPKTAWENSELAQRVMEREGLENEEELQSYFIKRIEDFLNEHGRQIIGWDEILQGGLAPNATVMSWRGIEGGIKAAQQGHDVIMTPTSYCYLDYYQANPETEPLAIGGFTPLRKVYSYEPIPEVLTEEEAKHVLGTQGNLWTEYILTGDKVEYMVYPRASALAEIGWSAKTDRNWDSFWQRMQPLFKRFEIMGVNAAEHYRGQMPKLKQGD